VEHTAAGRRVVLRGLVASLDGRTVIRVEGAGGAARARAVGLEVADDARTRGADALL
jgi:hydroxymethylbilane synthase